MEVSLACSQAAQGGLQVRTVKGSDSLEPDFSVVLFRPKFMLVSEEYPMKTHKNQWLWPPLSPPDMLWRATNQDPYYGV